MNNIQFPSGFRLDEVLSRTNASYSCRVTDTHGGETYFAKVSRDDSPLGASEAKRVLMESGRHQCSITYRGILPLLGEHASGQNHMLVFPWLDPSEWEPLTPTHLGEAPAQILTGMFLVLDFLHHQQLVHCDIKLDNFMVSKTGGQPRLMLVDLDFLVKHDSLPRGKLYGTPEFMAPEVVKNDRIVIQTDHYSLGKALETCVEIVPPELREGLTTLCAELTGLEPLERPHNLLTAAVRRGIISDLEYADALKSLFAAGLLSSLRSRRRRAVRRHVTVQKFLEQCKVVGFAPEFQEDLQVGWTRSRSRTLKLFRRLVASSSLQLHMDFWVCTADAEAVLEAYHGLAEFCPSVRDTFLQVPVTGEGIQRDLERVQKLREDNQDYRAFLLLYRAKAVVEGKGTDELAIEDMQTFCHHLADLSLLYLPMKDAFVFQENLVDLLPPSSREASEAVVELIRRTAVAGDSALAQERIVHYLAEAKRTENTYLEYEIRRLRAWTMGGRGEVEEARRELLELERVIDVQAEPELMVKVVSGLGSLAMRRADRAEAEAHMKKGIQLARKYGVTGTLELIRVNLVTLYLGSAEFKKVIRQGRDALADVRTVIGKSYRGLIAWLLAIGYALLAQYDNSQQYLQHILAEASRGSSQYWIGTYYFTLGFQEMRRGRLTDAETYFQNYIQVLGSDLHTASVGVALSNIAILACWRGEPEKCREMGRRATEFLTRSGDRSALADTESRVAINDYVYGNSSDPTVLIKPLEKLVDAKSVLYAYVCLIHILLSHNKQGIKAALAIVEKLGFDSHDTGSAIILAANQITEYHRRLDESSAEDLPLLKAAYSALERSGERFLAFHVCRFIGDQYRDTDRLKLANKFYVQALRLAEGLTNQPLIEQVKIDIRQSEAVELQYANRLSAVHAISDVLSDVGDYQAALDRILRYAVQETGAERGVLSLRAGDSNDLQVKASLNCDSESVTDIQDFSRSIPDAVIEQDDPLIIDNALEDKRTKTYKSIAAHNIRSVMCVPVRAGKDLVGSLYLDHHTIPALFDDADVTFVKSMANFLSVVLRTVQTVRTATITSQELQSDLEKTGVGSRFVTRSPLVTKLKKRLPEIARTNATLLITGESGTGKEVLCRMIHDLSLRSEYPLTKLNCAAVPATMMEAELFGVARNAATGVAERAGKFESSDGGTLMLDEIGDMPLELQAKVLRVLECQEFERLGSNRTVYIDVRFLCATNKDLDRLVANDRFRLDLFHRINTITIEIPPLRERPEDVMVLLDHFLKQFCASASRMPKFSSDLMTFLLGYSWPGNVRELKNIAERCCILYPGQTVTLSDMPASMRNRAETKPEETPIVAGAERARMIELLERHNWNKSKVATLMHIPYSTFRRKLQKYGINRPL